MVSQHFLHLECKQCWSQPRGTIKTSKQQVELVSGAQKNMLETILMQEKTSSQTQGDSEDELCPGSLSLSQQKKVTSICEYYLRAWFSPLVWQFSRWASCGPRFNLQYIHMLQISATLLTYALTLAIKHKETIHMCFIMILDWSFEFWAAERLQSLKNIFLLRFDRNRNAFHPVADARHLMKN